MDRRWVAPRVNWRGGRPRVWGPPFSMARGEGHGKGGENLDSALYRESASVREEDPKTPEESNLVKKWDSVLLLEEGNLGAPTGGELHPRPQGVPKAPPKAGSRVLGAPKFSSCCEKVPEHWGCPSGVSGMSSECLAEGTFQAYLSMDPPPVVHLGRGDHGWRPEARASEPQDAWGPTGGCPGVCGSGGPCAGSGPGPSGRPAEVAPWGPGLAGADEEARDQPHLTGAPPGGAPGRCGVVAGKEVGVLQSAEESELADCRQSELGPGTGFGPNGQICRMIRQQIGAPHPPDFVLQERGEDETMGALVPLERVMEENGLWRPQRMPQPFAEGFTFRVEHGMDNPLRNFLEGLLSRLQPPRTEINPHYPLACWNGSHSRSVRSRR